MAQSATIIGLSLCCILVLAFLHLSTEDTISDKQTSLEASIDRFVANTDRALDELSRKHAEFKEFITEVISELRGGIFTDTQKLNLFNWVAPRVVKVVSHFSKKGEKDVVMEGTGFLVEHGQPQILTANHVAHCDNSSWTTWAFFNRTEFFPSLNNLPHLRNQWTTEFDRPKGKTPIFPARYNKVIDYCLLRFASEKEWSLLKERGYATPPRIVPLVPTLDVHRGMQVWIIGYPNMGSSLTLTEGIVSQTAKPDSWEHQILTDSGAGNGSSGAPVCGRTGSFIGVVRSLDPESGNFASVIPPWAIVGDASAHLETSIPESTLEASEDSQKLKEEHDLDVVGQ